MKTSSKVFFILRTHLMEDRENNLIEDTKTYYGPKEEDLKGGYRLDSRYEDERGMRWRSDIGS